MKKSLFFFCLIILLTFFITIPNTHAQLEDTIEYLTGDNTKGYLQPFVNAFANNINAGLYRTARIPSMGLHFYFGLTGMATMIPDESLTYMAVPPLPYPQDPVETATVFGGEGTLLEGEQGLSFQFPGGQLQGDLVPFAIPQLEIGSVFGTVARVRFFAFEIPGEGGETLGKIELFGFGAQHSISQYIPLFPVDLSVGFFYQTFDVGDYLSTKALTYGLQISKSFSFLTVYGGAALESATMNVNYTYQAEDITQEIALELESEGKFRFTAGGYLKLGFVHLNGDVTIGKQNTFSLGLGFGI